MKLLGESTPGLIHCPPCLSSHWDKVEFHSSDMWNHSDTWNHGVFMCFEWFSNQTRQRSVQKCESYLPPTNLHTHTHSIDRGKWRRPECIPFIPCQTHYSALRICGWQNCQHNPIHVYALTGLWGLPFDHWSSRWSTGSKSANCQDLAGSQRMEWEASRPAGIAVDVIIDRW